MSDRKKMDQGCEQRPKDQLSVYMFIVITMTLCDVIVVYYCFTA